MSKKALARQKGKRVGNNAPDAFNEGRPGGLDVALPKSRLCRMRYASWIAFAGTSGVLEHQRVSCGSVYDPDTTGVGHSALGHDQWALFYDNYVVLKARLTAHIQFTGSASGGAMPIVGIFRDDNASATGTSWDAFVEQGRGSHKMLAPSVSSTTPPTIICSYDAKRDFNLSDVKDNVSRIGGVFGASPSDVMTFDIWSQAVDKATTAPVTVVYFVDYIVAVSQPKELAQS